MQRKGGWTFQRLEMGLLLALSLSSVAAAAVEPQILTAKQAEDFRARPGTRDFGVPATTLISQRYILRTGAKDERGDCAYAASDFVMDPKKFETMDHFSQTVAENRDTCETVEVDGYIRRRAR